MASTAPKVAAEEKFEPPEVIHRKAQELVELINKSKHLIAFTGAGISTSAGIPDFRGPDGAWTLRAQGRQRTKKTVSTLQAIPTPTHMALAELANRGILKYLVSQNCDGLHRKSGIHPDKLSELHGNSNREYCKGCGKDYIRDFRAVAKYEKTVHDHRTGRKCARCGGALHDSIINFGEALPADALRNAYDHAKAADLCLVLGSSLTVSPANDVPATVCRKRKAELVICNLQKTPLDYLSKLRIHSRTDDLMVQVMEKLDIPIPPFVLHRRMIVELETVNEEQHKLIVHGVDVDGTPVTFLRSVKLVNNRRVARTEPFELVFRDEVMPGMEFALRLEFMGHYGEPDLEIVYTVPEGPGSPKTLYLLRYHPTTGVWETSRQDGAG
ncbi:DHS-like NAD/FAD-binding domain-containing protein [Coniochaeta sp. 2T2.1]|nr:DHS-like NAD/FAD-binding domain-containing protein [Coniochaeta sp. 2T2.1]